MIKHKTDWQLFFEVLGASSLMIVAGAILGGLIQAWLNLVFFRPPQ